MKKSLNQEIALRLNSLKVGNSQWVQSMVKRWLAEPGSILSVYDGPFGPEVLVLRPGQVPLFPKSKWVMNVKLGTLKLPLPKGKFPKARKKPLSGQQGH